MAPNKDDLIAEVERLAELAEVLVDIEGLTVDGLKEKILELTSVIEDATAPDNDEAITMSESSAPVEVSNGYVVADGVCIRSVRGRMMVGGDQVFVEDFGGVAANMQKHIDIGQVVEK